MDEVSSNTVIKCFKHTDLYPEGEVDQEDDDPFEVEELSGKQFLVNPIYASCSTKEFVHCEDDHDVCTGIINEFDPEWRAKVQEEVLFADKDEMEEEIRIEHCASRKRKREHQKLYPIKKHYKPKKSF